MTVLVDSGGMAISGETTGRVPRNRGGHPGDLELGNQQILFSLQDQTMRLLKDEWLFLLLSSELQI